MNNAEYVDHLGDDLRVVNAARVSFDKESFETTAPDMAEQDHPLYPDWVKYVTVGRGKLAEERPVVEFDDYRLIHYLSKNGHWTPFSHPMVTMRETVPIFVARQRFKHMVGFTYNEVSRRYVDDTPEFYVPDTWRKRPDEHIKQGSGLDFTGGDVGVLDRSIKYWHEQAEVYYNSLLDHGVAPEQARMVLPQSMLTSYYVTGSLAAWGRAYKQRSDSHAQKEIRDLAEDWNTIMAPLFPVAWEALSS